MKGRHTDGWNFTGGREEIDHVLVRWQRPYRVGEPRWQLHDHRLALPRRGQAKEAACGPRADAHGPCEQGTGRNEVKVFMNDKEKLNACLRELSTANAARKFLYDENQRLQAISCKPAKQWYVAHVQRVMLDGEPLFKAD